MKRARVLVLILGITAIVTGLPRRAVADDFGRNVLIGALIGGVVGGIVAIARASSAPRPAPVAAAPHGPRGWTAGDLASRTGREPPIQIDAESPWTHGVLLTF